MEDFELQILPWRWESWMEPFRDLIFLPCSDTLEDDINDEVVQAQIGLLFALNLRGVLSPQCDRPTPKDG